MTKQEFLSGLRDALLAEGADALVQENLRYYSDYIDGETAKGRSEEDVTGELGGPALIANSILEAAGYVVDGVPDVNPGGDAGTRERERSAYAEEDRSFGAGEDASGEMPGGSGWHVWHTGGGGSLIAVLVIIILVILLLLSLVVGAAVFFAPVIVVLLVVEMILSLFRGRRF